MTEKPGPVRIWSENKKRITTLNTFKKTNKQETKNRVKFGIPTNGLVMYMARFVERLTLGYFEENELEGDHK